MTKQSSIKRQRFIRMAQQLLRRKRIVLHLRGDQHMAQSLARYLDHAAHNQQQTVAALWQSNRARAMLWTRHARQGHSQPASANPE